MWVMTLEELPGGDLVARGLADLERGRETVESLLVAVGAPRLRQLGFSAHAPLPTNPEHRLSELGESSSMRRLADAERIHELLGRLGQEARSTSS